MRTTIRLPDRLYDDVKKLASDEGTTVTSVIEEALRALIDRHGKTEPARAFRITPYVASVPGLQPGVDLSDSVALQDLMDEADGSFRADA